MTSPPRMRSSTFHLRGLSSLACRGSRLLPHWRHDALRALRALLWLVLACGIGLVTLPLQAQGKPSFPSSSAVGNGGATDKPQLPNVEELRQQLDAIPQTLTESEDDGRKLLNDVYAIGSTAGQLVSRRTADLADVDSRLSGLGPAPEKGTAPDTPDVAQQRSILSKQRSVLDAEVKLARLVSVDAEQRATDFIRQRREQFQASLSARVDSPLTGAFWRNLLNTVPADLARLSALRDDWHAAIGRAMAPGARGIFLASLLAALLMAVPGTLLAERILVRLAPARLPAGRLRRSLLASASMLAYVLLISAAAHLAWSGLEAGGELGDKLSKLSATSVRLAILATFVIGLGHALLSRKRSSWRLPALSDDLATRLSPYPWWLAIVASVGGLITEINSTVGASLAAEVTAHAVMALAVATIVICALRHLRTPAQEEAGPGGSPPASVAPGRPAWAGLLIACAGLASAVTVLLVVSGYVALAGLLARQMVWSGVVFASVYLLAQLIDDVCEAALSSKGSFGARLHKSLAIDARLLDQTSVLVSGVLRLALFFYMAIALMAPFGTGPEELFRRGSTVESNLSVGNFTLAPQALLTGLAVLVIGLILIRVLKRWLSDRYFPNTALEPGMRSSIVTLLGYVGFVVVVAATLASLGISVERIAWVASALSVGIGFGLQAIVQNFISGLILLAERPVNVGDWVVLGDTEGDVRRVNVRATEIQLGDRSTVIVPNSEFITKTVRNMTLTGAPGRVLLRLPAPLNTDAKRMRELILQAFVEHEGIMDMPAPSVQLEGILNGTLTFLAVGYVSNPRNASGVRSDLLFAILESLHAAGLALSPPATTAVAALDLLQAPSPTPPEPSGRGVPTAT